MTQSDLVKKKWLLVWYLNCGKMSSSSISDYITHAKQSMPNQIFSNFFETEVLQIYIPSQEKTELRIHEIILEQNGYDNFDIVLQDNNLSTHELLDKLKELIDVKK